MMTKWIDYLKQNSDGFIRPDSGWGDWLSVDADTPKDLLGTAYFAYSTLLTARVAQVLSKTSEAKEYTALFEQIKQAYIKKFVTEDGQVYGQTQSGYLLSLHIGLLPDHLIAAAEDHLVSDIKRRGFRLTTGFLGISYLNPTLTRIGRSDVAYELLMQQEFPSWLYEVNQGATTIWERWDSWTKDKGFQSTSMNSFNHYSFGSVGHWLMADVAGIDTQEPGFRRIKLCPQRNEKLQYVKASYKSVSGLIKSHWWYEPSGKWQWTVEIPANTIASVYVPCEAQSLLRESGCLIDQHAEITQMRRADGYVLLELGSGTYEFTVEPIANTSQRVGRKMSRKVIAEKPVASSPVYQKPQIV